MEKRSQSSRVRCERLCSSAGSRPNCAAQLRRFFQRSEMIGNVRKISALRVATIFVNRTFSDIFGVSRVHQIAKDRQAAPASKMFPLRIPVPLRAAAPAGATSLDRTALAVGKAGKLRPRLPLSPRRELRKLGCVHDVLTIRWALGPSRSRCRDMIFTQRPARAFQHRITRKPLTEKRTKRLWPDPKLTRHVCRRDLIPEGEVANELVQVAQPIRNLLRPPTQFRMCTDKRMIGDEVAEDAGQQMSAVQRLVCGKWIGRSFVFVVSRSHIATAEMKIVGCASAHHLSHWCAEAHPTFSHRRQSSIHLHARQIIELRNHRCSSITRTQPRRLVHIALHPSIERRVLPRVRAGRQGVLDWVVM